jgi:hypothetical protein
VKIAELHSAIRVGADLRGQLWKYFHGDLSFDVFGNVKV